MKSKRGKQKELSQGEHVLPLELLELIQEYVVGECFYIPRKEENKKIWGEKTGIRLEMKKRNKGIFKK